MNINTLDLDVKHCIHTCEPEEEGLYVVSRNTWPSAVYFSYWTGTQWNLISREYEVAMSVTSKSVDCYNIHSITHFQGIK